MRDVSKVLSDAEVIKLREMLRGLPEAAPASSFEEYPKMLFHPEWYGFYRLAKESPDPLAQKEAKMKIRTFQVIVHNIEEEEDYLAEGWVGDPNDLAIAANLAINPESQHADPRQPFGREGRRQRAASQRDRQARLEAIRREYAELTGTRIADAPVASDIDMTGQQGVSLEAALQQIEHGAVEPDAVPMSAAEKKAAAKAAGRRAATA